MDPQLIIRSKRRRIVPMDALGIGIANGFLLNSGKGRQGSPTPPGFVWDNMAAVTNVWIADPAYLSGAGSNVDTWLPEKGSISLVKGPVAPTQSATWGPGSLGCVTYDGTSMYHTGDALAALVAGTNMPYTLIFACQMLSNAFGQSVLAFADNTASIRDYCGVQIDQASHSTHHWVTVRGDTSGNERYGDSTVDVDITRKVVVTNWFSSGSGAFRFNGGTTISGFGLNIDPMAATRFTVGAGRGNVAAAFANVIVRAIVFAPSLLSSADYIAIENYLLSELAAGPSTFDPTFDGSFS